MRQISILRWGGSDLDLHAVVRLAKSEPQDLQPGGGGGEVGGLGWLRGFRKTLFKISSIYSYFSDSSYTLFCKFNLMLIRILLFHCKWRIMIGGKSIKREKYEEPKRISFWSEAETERSRTHSRSGSSPRPRHSVLRRTNKPSSTADMQISFRNQCECHQVPHCKSV